MGLGLRRPQQGKCEHLWCINHLRGAFQDASWGWVGSANLLRSCLCIQSMQYRAYEAVLSSLHRPRMRLVAVMRGLRLDSTGEAEGMDVTGIISRIPTRCSP
jgi:hypothetical protein